MNIDTSTYIILNIICIFGVAIGLYLYYQGKLKLLAEKLSQQIASTNSAASLLQEEKESNRQLQEESSELNTQLITSRERQKHLQELYDKELVNSDFRKQEFENIANKVLAKQAASFDDHQQKEIKQLLEPLKSQIERFENRVEKTHQDSSEKIISLKEQIKQLSDKSDQVSQDANNLAKALKGDSKLQGNWGEIILESILDKSGLEKDREYVVQQSQRDSDGRAKRPDIVIHLPEDKKLIIDSKVSLRAYDDMVNAIEELDQRKHQKIHSQAVRKHIDDLNGKNYHDLYQIQSPDFVLMFIPIDTAFSAALLQDQTLYQYAFDRNIVIVTPSTLLATLKTVESLWRNDKQNRYALEIASEAGKMYDKFVAYVEDMEKMGNQLQTVQKTYDNSMKKLSSGSGNLIGRADKIKSLGIKANKQLPSSLGEAMTG